MLQLEKKEWFLKAAAWQDQSSWNHKQGQITESWAQNAPSYIMSIMV